MQTGRVLEFGLHSDPVQVPVSVQIFMVMVTSHDCTRGN